jgi:hypothetical protein
MVRRARYLCLCFGGGKCGEWSSDRPIWLVIRWEMSTEDNGDDLGTPESDQGHATFSPGSEYTCLDGSVGAHILNRILLLSLLSPD